MLDRARIAPGFDLVHATIIRKHLRQGHIFCLVNFIQDLKLAYINHAHRCFTCAGHRRGGGGRPGAQDTRSPPVNFASQRDAARQSRIQARAPAREWEIQGELVAMLPRLSCLDDCWKGVDLPLSINCTNTRDVPRNCRPP